MLTDISISIILAMTVLIQMSQLAADSIDLDESQRGCDYVEFQLIQQTSNGTLESTKACLNQTTTIFDNKLDPSRPTVVLVAGFRGPQTDFTRLMIHTFLDTTSMQVNVIHVNWTALSMQQYPNARLSVKPVGTVCAGFIKRINTTLQVPVNNVKCIGHSLGAHICGVAGHILEALGLSVKIIIGLDPAWPLFFIKKDGEMLTEKSAPCVVVLHTNAGQLGTPLQLGHCNYWANNGKHQPGCGIDPTHLPGYCSHLKSYEIYAGALMNETAVNATVCSNYISYCFRRCVGNDWGLLGAMNCDVCQGEQKDLYFSTGNKSFFLAC